MKRSLQRLLTVLRPRRSPMILALAVSLGFLIGYGFNGEDPEAHHSPALETHTAEDGAKEGMVYVCTMSCVPPMRAPGNCPICGMQLVPVYDAHSGDKSGPPRVRFAAEALKLAEIQTSPVERKAISAGIRLFGQIDYDPAHIATISSFMPGVIDRVYVKRPGVFVRWGQPLFDLSSPDLLETQRDLIEAMKVVPSFLAFQAGLPHAAREMPVQDLESAENRKDRSPQKEAALKKIGAVRHKLSLLGLPKRDIDELMQKGEATGVATIYSSIYGQVVEVKANEGTYVNRGATIFTLGDPRHVWALLEAYEADYPWIRLNQEVTFDTDAYPGETFAGKVVYIDPVFNAKTRTFRIGAISPDQGGRLKAGMLVRAVVHAQLSAEGKVSGEKGIPDAAPLVIPASAPLVTGKRAVVYVRVSGEEELFEGREVTLGPRSGTHYVVLAGLQEGDEVVKNGSFKIDSAVQILAKRSMMDIEGGHSAIAHHHHGGSDPMHEDFRERRLQNLTEGEHRMEGKEHRPEVPEVDGNREELESFRSQMGQRKSITRRRPGAYGDSAKPEFPGRRQQGVGTPAKPHAESPLRSDKQ
ncbi:MAG: hypothetical protein CVU64_18080 [Deltaproteobacteria bacterium HGW-Deltaproteobacteria-21]|nr:MAG: hypothetical protein CVU64_18080 [Deltaproteobacteria bacterium HGW-Deltaproteobacteria-21]